MTRYYAFSQHYLLDKSLSHFGQSKLLQYHHRNIYFRDILRFLECDQKMVNYHLKLQHNYTRNNELDVLIYFNESRRKSNPKPTSVCISCEPTHELCTTTLLNEKQYSFIHLLTVSDLCLTFAWNMWRASIRLVSSFVLVFFSDTNLTWLVFEGLCLKIKYLMAANEDLICWNFLLFVVQEFEPVARSVKAKFLDCTISPFLP